MDCPVSGLIPRGGRFCRGRLALGRPGRKQKRPAEEGRAYLNLGGGEEEDRTPDLVIANDALSQLSYFPERSENYSNIFSPLLGGPPVFAAGRGG